MRSTRYICQVLLNLEISQHIFEKNSNLSSRSRVVTCRRADRRMYVRTDRLTGMTKLIVAFRNYSNAPKNLSLYFAKSLASRWPAVKKICTPLAQIISEKALYFTSRNKVSFCNFTTVGLYLQ